MTWKIWITAAGLALAAGACDSGPGPSQTPEPETAPAPEAKSEAPALLSEPMPLGRLGDTLSPIKYTLNLTIDPSQETFSGTTVIEANLVRDVDGLWIHGRDIAVESAEVETEDGRRVTATYDQRHVTGIARLDLSEPVAAGPVKLYLTYTAPFATSPQGLYRTEREGAFYAATQFEPIDARRVFPGLDEPRFKVPFDVTVTARTDDVVVTTMPETAREDLGNGMTRRTYATTPPLPTYLLAFAVGPYDINGAEPIAANAVRAEPLPFRGVAVKGQGPRMDYALRNTPGILAFQEDYFGIGHPYPKLDIIAAPDFFGGAMENVGAIIYNEFLMLMDEASPLRQRRAYTFVHAHELAHQWFGNLVTPAWWDDIWLNEAFASWMENKTAAAYWPEGEFDRATLKQALSAMAEDSLAAARQIREPVEVNEAIEDAFDGITYNKGAGVLAMFESYVGEEAFRNGVRLHMTRHANSVATVEDFMASIADGSETPEVVPAFRSFIDQPGVPYVETSVTCENDKPLFTVRQSRYAPLGSSIRTGKTWQIPLCVAYTVDGERQRTCALVTEAEQVIDPDIASCPTAVVPNADGAAYVRFTFDRRGWQDLLPHVQSLSAKEALAYGDSLTATFEDGRIGAGDMLDGLAALAKHDAWDVSALPQGTLGFLKRTLLAPEDHPDLEAFARTLMRPVYDALPEPGDGETPADILRRTDLVRFLALTAKDPELRAEMARQAAAYVGLESDADPSAVSGDLLPTVLIVGVEDLGAPFFEALLTMMDESSDPGLRQYAVSALASTEDAALAARLRDLAMTEAFTSVELIRVLYGQARQRETQEDWWTWMQANFDAVAARLPSLYRSSIAEIGGSFCSPERKAEFTALIEANAEAIPGYKRSLAKAVESIDLCIALRDAKAEELATAIKARL
ncbi:MAG: M1 family aminopeptidase [Alphaproteobacteria bacterium]